MQDTIPPSRAAAQQYYLTRYQTWMAKGTYFPVTYPSFTYGVSILLLFLLIPPSSRFHNRFTRYATFAIVAYVHTWMTVNMRASSPPLSYLFGIVFGWGTVWSATLLVFNDAKVEFKRLERRRRTRGVAAEGFSSGSEHASQGNDGLRRRDIQSTRASQEGDHQSAEESSDYVWQPYPEDNFFHCLYWNLELVCSFRGLGWNWHIADLPSLPPSVQSAADKSNVHNISSTTTDNKAAASNDESTPKDRKDTINTRTGLHRFDTRRALLIHNAYLFIRTYLLVDLVISLTLHDPYFWAPNPISNPILTPIPPSYLSLIRSSTILLRTTRLVISLSGAWLILRMIFTLGPFFFVGILNPYGILGPTYTQPWLYPDQFGYFSNLTDRGLAGFWAGWWHQMFRFAFQSAGKWTCAQLGLSEKSKLGRAAGVLAAFTVSGFIHASGSTTALGSTRPWSGSFVFFVLQGVGILVQTGWRQYLKSLQSPSAAQYIPVWLGRVCNVLFAALWLYFTGPLLADDFSRAGIYTFEYVPFSVFRALGFVGEESGMRRVLVWKTGLFVGSWWYFERGWRTLWRSGVAL